MGYHCESPQPFIEANQHFGDDAALFGVVDYSQAEV
jgi:hypothetical protein